ncbi:MAG: Bor family protein [Bacteroidetes bacterium]|nr:Bor family protein [Bacteroidota bacterium]
MKKSFVVLLLAASVSLSGCYHTEIVTGKEPGSKVVEQEWAMSFIGGLVPPKMVDVSDVCTSGVAVVETELSFLNMLVGALTFSIFTPMHITVTCAADGMMGSADDADLSLSRSAESAEVQAVIEKAAGLSADLHRPVRISLSE